MNDSQKLRTITFKDFLTLFVRKLWLIILISLLCIGAVFLQQQFFFTPEYESTATLYILKRENESTYNYTNSDTKDNRCNTQIQSQDFSNNFRKPIIRKRRAATSISL